MIEYLWRILVEDVWGFFASNFDPVRDSLDILLVALGVYWLLLLIRGTRAVQILVGLILLVGVWLMAQILELGTVQWILANFVGYAVFIVIVLFQHDLRRALARVGGGIFPVARGAESQILEEVVRAAQTLAQRRVGGLIVLERETHLRDLIEAGVMIDADVSKELLISIFLPYSPLHDGAVLIQDGRITSAGCILPLTMRDDLPEGVGTRHRAAVGITEESDAVVVVVSEETSSLSLVFGGKMVRDLDGPRLREILRDILSGQAPDSGEASEPGEPAGASEAERVARSVETSG